MSIESLLQISRVMRADAAVVQCVSPFSKVFSFFCFSRRVSYIFGINLLRVVCSRKYLYLGVAGGISIPVYLLSIEVFSGMTICRKSISCVVQKWYLCSKIFIRLSICSEKDSFCSVYCADRLFEPEKRNRCPSFPIRTSLHIFSLFCNMIIFSFSRSLFSSFRSCGDNDCSNAFAYASFHIFETEIFVFAWKRKWYIFFKYVENI